MHVAAGFGVPQVAVFGSTSPLHTPPLNREGARPLAEGRARPGLHALLRPRCRFGHYRCLTEVAPERVLASLDDAAAQSENLPA